MIYLDGYPIDVLLRGSVNMPSGVTQHPVEEGGSITDHVDNGPITIKIEGVVSDSPPIDGSVLVPGDDALQSDAALAKLVEIRNDKRAITIETYRGIHRNMIMTDLTVPEDPDTSGGLFFTASFQQVETATNKRVSVRVAVPMGKPKINLGNKEAKGPLTRSANAGPAVRVVDGNGKILDDAKKSEKAGKFVDKDGVALFDENAPQENSTYFDQDRDEWVNTDGTPVTQNQLTAKESPSVFSDVDGVQSDSSPWWNE